MAEVVERKGRQQTAHLGEECQVGQDRRIPWQNKESSPAFTDQDHSTQIVARTSDLQHL